MKAVLFNDTSFDHHLGCQLVVRQIYELSQRHGIEVTTVSPVKYKWQKDRKLLRAVKDADLVLVNGEGTLHSDNRRALRLIKVADYCEMIGKPSFLINALYFNNTEEMHASVRKFTGVFVRDKQSQAELRSLKVDAKYCPDLTLSIEPHVHNKGEGELLIIDSNDLDVTAELYKKHMAVGGSEFRTMLSKPRIQRGKSRKYFLMKSYVNRYFFKVKQKKAFKKESVSNEDVHVIYREKNVNSMLELFAKSSGVITGRFHGACYALVTRTPFIACAASAMKVENLLKEVGITGRFSTLEDLPNAKVSSYTDQEILSIELFTKECGQLASEMFKSIANCVRRGM